MPRNSSRILRSLLETGKPLGKVMRNDSVKGVEQYPALEAPVSIYVEGGSLL